MSLATPEKKRKTTEVDESSPTLKAIVITPSPKKKGLFKLNKPDDVLEQESSESSSQSNNTQHMFKFHSSSVLIQENTKKAYALIQKMTGKIGGNAHGGAIYGELTIGSMQRLVDLMKRRTGFDQHSRFIDVGSGLGKPSIHVAQDPGVAFSYGIEMEYVRWSLGLANLSQVLDEVQKEKGHLNNIPNTTENIGYKCILECGDIRSAKTFDPFTHVYMFDIG